MNLEEYEIMYRVEDTLWWYHALRGRIADAWTRFGSGASGRVLDVGCGTGANLAAFPASVQAYGIDFSPVAVQFCRRRGLPRTTAASALALPFGDGAFDAAVSCDVFCHKSIPDPREAIREIARVVRPGGHVFLNLPAYQWLMSSHDTAVHTARRFTRGQLRRMLPECGLDVVAATYWNTLLFPPILAVRLWRKWFPPGKSDLDDEVSEGRNKLFSALLEVERRMIRTFPMPFGLSVFVVGRRNG